MKTPDWIDLSLNPKGISFKGQGQNVALVAMAIVFCSVLGFVLHKGFTQMSHTIETISIQQLDRIEQRFEVLESNQKIIADGHEKQHREQAIQTWLLSLPEDRRPEFVAPVDISGRIKHDPVQ